MFELENVVERRLCGDAGEVHHRVDVTHCVGHRLFVADIRDDHVAVVVERAIVEQAESPFRRGQPVAEVGPDPSCGTGDQDARGFVGRRGHVITLRYFPLYSVSEDEFA